MVKLAVVIEGKKTIEFESGVKTNVEVVDGKLQLEVVGEGSAISDKSAVPSMNANNSPAPFEAFASSQFNSNFQPYRAFDDDPDTRWASAADKVENEWIGIFLGEQKKIVRYAIHCTETVSLALTQMPKEWILEGSNDSIVWDNLGRVSDNTPWVFSEKRTYDVDNPNYYSYYRLYVISNHGYSVVNIPKLELYEELHFLTYAPSGTLTTPVLDFGAYYRELKTISAIRNVPSGTELKIYTSTSNDLKSFSPFEEINYETGEILSPQGRYMKIKIELMGRLFRANITQNRFTENEANRFRSSKYIDFVDGLKLKTNYIELMSETMSWEEEGKLFRKRVEVDEFQKINKLKHRLFTS